MVAQDADIEPSYSGGMSGPCQPSSNPGLLRTERHPAKAPAHHIAVDARYLKHRGIGISWYVREGIGDLINAGARLTLLTDDDDDRATLLCAYPSAAVVVLPGRSGFLWEQRTLARHLASAGYDAYVAPANYGLPLAYRGSTPLILVVHDLIPLRLPHLYLLRRPLWAGKYLLSVAIAAVRADDVIAVSHATARDIGRFLRRSTLSVSYPPIPRTDDERAGADHPGLSPQMPGGTLSGVRGRYFVYNGGSDIRKNVPTLLRAFALVRAEIPTIELVMIGAGYERFRRVIDDLGIADFVHTPGYVEEAVKAGILANAAALIYPSRIEGFGLPVVEALAVGIPVVSGTGGSLPEIGGDAVNYVHPLDEHSLAAAMITVTSEIARTRAKSAGDTQLRLLRTHQEAHTLAKAVAASVARAGRN
jgi:glycosyltransferase involved in cell wall biosynthesis